MRKRLIALLCVVAWGTSIERSASGEEFFARTFARQQLTGEYYSEGIAAGDLNSDGVVDIVYGPHWYAGPSFKEAREIYPAKPQNRDKYADHFFAWIYDVDGDGRNDVLTAGFPGTPGFVYKNPGEVSNSAAWSKHQVLNSVSNESPQFVQLVGDERPELVCTNAGFFGYAEIDQEKPLGAWKFHAISDKVAPVPFGHGLGVGDVNGDGRQDVLMKDGWYEQPATTDDSGRWQFHKASFAGPGGAEIYAYDVDGDGDNDVITSLAAHDFGLAWHEQVKENGEFAFRKHLIMGDRPEQNRYGLVFSELHSVNLADIDGDGLKDIVTGKTYWSHHRQSPLWDAGAVVYWFRLVRGKDGVDWVPYRADDQAGIGRQIFVNDINKDGLPDFAVGGMKGAHVLLQRREAVSEEKWKELQPKLHVGTASSPPRGVEAPINDKGRVAGALEGESLNVLKASAGRTIVQQMDGFKAGRWSGDAQLFWTGAKPGATLDLELNAVKEGKYDIAAAFTLASDYAKIKLKLDDEPLGDELDLFNSPDVLASGELKLGSRPLSAGAHKLTIEITGANPSAVMKHMVGLDYVRLQAK